MPKLYIGGLPMSPKRDGSLEERVWESTKKLVSDEFTRFGEVRSVWVARKPPGFAFVEMDRVDDAEKAIKALDREHGWRVEMSDRRPRVGRSAPYAAPPPSRGGRERSRSRDRGGDRDRYRDRSRERDRSRDRGGRDDRRERSDRARDRSRSRDRSDRYRRASPPRERAPPPPRDRSVSRDRDRSRSRSPPRREDHMDDDRRD